MSVEENSNSNNEHNNPIEEKPVKNIISDSMILDIIMSNSQDTIYFKDRNTKFIANSKAHANQFGYENPRDLIGKSDFDFFPEEFARKAYLDEMKIMQTGIPILGKEEKLVSSDGTCIWFLASKYPIISDNGEIIGTWGTSRDITSLKLTQENLAKTNDKLEETNLELQKLSDLDGLSELYNQRKFHKVLEETIETYQKKRNLGIECTFCVMLFDIDDFKLINDQYGHPTGDKAIHFLADIIRNNKREIDNCFRCGGDEFAVILFDTQLIDGLHMAERLRKEIDESIFKTENSKVNITISVGVEEYKENDTMYKLLTKVDKKLYKSKINGKNQVH